jgi:GMP synthase (glutamine-hydrolysing)
LFADVQNSFCATAMHHDSISLPTGFTLIATTSACYNQGMKKNDRPWYSFQFHPEIDNEWLIKRFLFLAKQAGSKSRLV